MDKIFLREYTVVAKHGYYKEEHEKPQRFVVSITAVCDVHQAGKSDDLTETLNYEILRKIVNDVLIRSPYNLLESLAEEMANALLQHPKAASVEVEIAKPDVWGDCSPGVSIVRGR
jgi:7,8-dihydroneopterin aldolase/epimerase/oxygenase